MCRWEARCQSHRSGIAESAIAEAANRRRCLSGDGRQRQPLGKVKYGDNIKLTRANSTGNIGNVWHSFNVCKFIGLPLSVMVTRASERILSLLPIIFFVGFDIWFLLQETS